MNRANPTQTEVRATVLRKRLMTHGGTGFSLCSFGASVDFCHRLLGASEETGHGHGSSTGKTPMENRHHRPPRLSVLSRGQFHTLLGFTDSNFLCPAPT